MMSLRIILPMVSLLYIKLLFAVVEIMKYICSWMYGTCVRVCVYAMIDETTHKRLQ